MADHNAHTYFGQEVMKRLPRDLQSHCTGDLPAFHLGLYGPDPLIFSFKTKKTSDKLHKQWRDVSLPALTKALRHGNWTTPSIPPSTAGWKRGRPTSAWRWPWTSSS